MMLYLMMGFGLPDRQRRVSGIICCLRNWVTPCFRSSAPDSGKVRQMTTVTNKAVANKNKEVEEDSLSATSSSSSSCLTCRVACHYCGHVAPANANNVNEISTCYSCSSMYSESATSDAKLIAVKQQRASRSSRRQQRESSLLIFACDKVAIFSPSSLSFLLGNRLGLHEEKVHLPVSLKNCLQSF